MYKLTTRSPLRYPGGKSRALSIILPLCRSKFYNLQKHFRELPNKLERAAVFFVLNRSSFSGTTLSGGMSPGHKRFTPSAIKRLKNFRSAGLKVRKVHYKVALREHPAIMAYLDPPYLISSNNLYGLRGDAHKGFDHEELSVVLQKRNKWVLSYNDCPEIRELYKYAQILETKWAYSMGNRKKSEELLIINI